VVDLRNFLVNTDYPLDQIIYLDSGSFTATTSVLGTTVTIPHTLAFKPLMAVNWSLESDFSTTRESNLPTFEGVDPYAIRIENKASSTNLVINAFNPTASDVTIYWRAYGFMPSNVNVDVAPTAILADNFVFNTDYNYPKLWFNDIVSVSTTITHNFAYRPQVMAWSDDGTYTTQLNTFGGVKCDTNTVTVTSPSNDVHLRIYGDSQI
jgi:hypothetical protein